MTLASLFDGISGFPLAASRCGVDFAWSAEIDAQCRSVAAKHFPDAITYDDVRRVRAYLEQRNAGRFAAARPVRPDILTGGFPCQDLSVAGQRAGLAGSRSGLWFEFRRIIALLRPRWVLIENVPGLLSSNKGDDLRIVLSGLGQLGYGYAFRVLDAQWFGVPQRRRRVFVVGCFGDWRRAAEVLFERDSLPWDSPPSREARARVAASLTAGVAASSGVNRPGRRREDDTNLVGGTFQNTGQGWWNESPVAQTIRTPEGGGSMEANVIAHTLRAEGHDASEDGTGRGVPLIPVGPLNAHSREHGHAMTTQQAAESGHLIPVGIDGGDLAHAVNGDGSKFGSGRQGQDTFVVEPDPFIFQTRIARNGRGQPKEIADNLTSCEGGTQATRSGVRRLTPRECERLQGFPDDWTRYAADGSEISDSARYRMLGNSVAVPVVEWIMRRLVASEAA